MRHCHRFVVPFVLLATLLALVLTPGAAAASCTYPAPCIPPLTSCGYASTCLLTYPMGVSYRNLAIHDFSACVTVMPGQVTAGGFNCLVDLDVDWGAGWNSYSNVPASGWMVFTWTGTGSQGEDQYSAQLAQLDFSGGGLPEVVMFRESPMLTSSGQASTLVAGNDYHIDSFFDVFVEISLDDGNSWYAAPSSCHIDLGPRGPVPVRSSTWGSIKTLYR